MRSHVMHKFQVKIEHIIIFTNEISLVHKKRQKSIPKKNEDFFLSQHLY